VIDEIRQGTSKHLFNPGNLITGKQDAASNYCKGHYSDGREIIDKSLNKIRNMAEQCDNL
jgi:tubulin alpha